MPTLSEAKSRLDKLIRKSRTHFYKPIAIAETLYRNRVGEDNVDLSELEQYRRRSETWCQLAYAALYGKIKSASNARYWDQLFDPAVLPPEMLVVLGEENRRTSGLVETYIYANLVDKSAAILGLASSLRSVSPQDFGLAQFISRFENDPRFKRSVDKVYEIVVYALFSAVTRHLRATVTLAVDLRQKEVLVDFEDFARLVLGIDSTHPQITHPARLYRVGTANAADAGLDMWANFGPAVQVKHLSLSPEDVDDICTYIQADQIIIVCKSMEAISIESVLQQVGLGGRIRGIITEQHLIKWYGIACGGKYYGTLGADLLEALRNEFALEFPLTQDLQVHAFLAERHYDVSQLTDLWSLQRIQEE